MTAVAIRAPGVRVSAPRAWKLTAPIAPETDLHEQVADALRLLLLPPAVWTTLGVGHMPLPGQFAAKLARLGVQPSWPDILVLHQRLFGIELKRPGGRLSIARVVPTRRGGHRYVAGQRETFPLLQAAGMTIGVCDSLSEVLAFLTSVDVPLRSHAVAA